VRRALFAWRLVRDVLLDVPRILHRVRQIVVVGHETVVFFTYDPGQGNGAIDERILIVDGRGDIPAGVRAEFLRARGLSLWAVMRVRMFRGATLLCLIEDGRLRAYGWMRAYDPLPRRYRWLARRALLLGYFWVEPSQRGRGLYGSLLNTCIALSDDRRSMPLLVYADATNTTSIHGLEKAGFARLGTYDVVSGLMGLICGHRAIAENSTIDEVWSAKV
jgi:hypothetical protein